MIKQGQRTGTGSQRPILRIREPLSSAFIGDTEPKQWQTNPRDLDAEMITRLPVATAEDHRQSVHGLRRRRRRHAARGRAAAGRVSRRDSPRLGRDHTVEDDPGAGLMNTVTKYMVSCTLTKVD
jgi:hypothetical protein